MPICMPDKIPNRKVFSGDNAALAFPMSTTLLYILTGGLNSGTSSLIAEFITVFPLVILAIFIDLIAYASDFPTKLVATKLMIKNLFCGTIQNQKAFESEII